MSENSWTQVKMEICIYYEEEKDSYSIYPYYLP